MQLSLFNLGSHTEKRVFLDIFAKMKLEDSNRKPVLVTLQDQQVPVHLKVKCIGRKISPFPEGTIFKLDARLVSSPRQSPYLTAIKNENITRALEFFDHNIQLQKSDTTEKKTKVRKRNQVIRKPSVTVPISGAIEINF